MIWLHHSLPRVVLLTVAITSTLGGCGEKVVVDAKGATGGGGGSVTSATTATTGAGGAADCDGLQADLQTKLAAAQACNPVLAVPQCNGSVTAVDLCGCTVVANDTSVKEAEIATAAFNAWIGAGCQPFSCLLCPPVGPDAPWHCDSTAAVCKPSFVK